MKTKLFIIFCIAAAFLLTNCKDNSTNNPVVEKKKIRTTTVYLIDLDDGNKYFWQRGIFDISGNIIEEYDSTETRQNRYYYQYDNNGRRISGTWRLIDIDFEEYGTISYGYDNNGNLILETTQDSDGSRRSKITYEYNSKNVLVKRNQHDGKDSIFVYDIFEYDAKGNMIKDCYYREGKLWLTYTYKYDKKGRIVEGSEPIVFLTIIMTKTFYSYNSDDELIEIKYYDEDGILILIHVFEYTYHD